jgi:hypothetical protein
MHSVAVVSKACRQLICVFMFNNRPRRKTRFSTSAEGEELDADSGCQQSSWHAHLLSAFL